MTQISLVHSPWPIGASYSEYVPMIPSQMQCLIFFFSWTGWLLLFIQSKQESSMFLSINFLLLQEVNREVVCSSTLIFYYFKEVDKFHDTNAVIVKSYFFSQKCGIFLGHIITLIRFCHYTMGWN